MNKYIVAYISFFDHVLLQAEIEAASDFEAAIKYLAMYQDITDIEEVSDLDSLVSLCFNWDSTISVYKI